MQEDEGKGQIVIAGGGSENFAIALCLFLLSLLMAEMKLLSWVSSEEFRWNDAKDNYNIKKERREFREENLLLKIMFSVVEAICKMSNAVSWGHYSLLVSFSGGV